MINGADPQVSRMHCPVDFPTGNSMTEKSSSLPSRSSILSQSILSMGTSGNLLWKWGAEKIPAGEAINAKLSGDSGRFSNEDSGDFI
ncbi:MAG: hypothetical protein ACI9NC_005818, partial [Verrucomicrobiales bacterium]